MPSSNDERVKQIRDDMQTLADKWHLEFVYRQDVSGQVAMQIVKICDASIFMR